MKNNAEWLIEMIRYLLLTFKLNLLANLFLINFSFNAITKKKKRKKIVDDFWILLFLPQQEYGCSINGKE